jgi:autophagy-related protein 9
MFNHKYQIRPAFYLDPAALRRRFQLCGIAHIIFMPFLLFFVTVYFGLQNAYDWKSTKQYLGPREWSIPAKWTFRELNELPHVFERRLAPSYKSAEDYLALFGTNELVAALGRILVFMGGSLGAVLFAFAAINDAILLHVKIADWNLLWYAGVFGVIYSGGKAMIPNAAAQPKSARNLFGEIDEALANVASHTHFYPETWQGRGWEHATYKAFSSMFKYKAKLFATEFASLILAPYILCVSLARCAEPICEFVLATRTEIPGAGEVCGYATFDFDKFGDERWEGRTLGLMGPMAGSLAESILQTGNVEVATSRFPKPKARYGKMEKSFFSFKVRFPLASSLMLLII